MGELEVTEISLACALVVLLLGITGIFVRRRLIAAGAPMFVCGFRGGSGDVWRYGVARFDTDALLVYTLGGVSLRPAVTVRRSTMDLVRTTPARRPAVPSLLEDAVLVELVDGGAPCQLAMGRDNAMAIRSWHEAVPPGRPPRAA